MTCCVLPETTTPTVHSAHCAPAILASVLRPAFASVFPSSQDTRSQSMICFPHLHLPLFKRHLIGKHDILPSPFLSMKLSRVLSCGPSGLLAQGQASGAELVLAFNLPLMTPVNLSTWCRPSLSLNTIKTGCPLEHVLSDLACFTTLLWLLLSFEL